MRFPKPFFRTSKNAWYLQVGKRQVSLGPDRTEAFTLYREVYVPQLGGTIERRRDFKTIVLCDLFLDLHKDKLKSWDWYHHFLVALVRQVPIATVAQLVGHSSTQTIERHYGHLDQKASYLKEAAKKATIGVA